MVTAQNLADDHRRASAQQSERLTDQEKNAVRALANNVPSLWTASTTTPQDRQTIARMMLDRVIVCVFGETDWKSRHYISDHPSCQAFRTT